MGQQAIFNGSFGGFFTPNCSTTASHRQEYGTTTRFWLFRLPVGGLSGLFLGVPFVSVVKPTFFCGRFFLGGSTVQRFAGLYRSICIKRCEILGFYR
jgi:hypothetical protein